LAAAQNAYIGRPDHLLYFGCGIGDDLLCTTVARELKKRGAERIVMFSRRPELFQFNPDIDATYNWGADAFGRLQHWGAKATHPCYFSYDSQTDRDTYPDKIIVSMCRAAKVTGKIQLRPYLHLTPHEKAKGRLFDSQVVIQSAGKGDLPTKDWFPDRYQVVADTLGARAKIIQLGLAGDPPIRNAVDLRGKTSLREAAAILAHAKVFVGQVGFLMHLARAVECRSVIVYGGREDPAITGYIANENIVGKTACSPCLFRSRCDFDHECMKIITPEMVITAALRTIECHEKPLPVETANIAG
jgi:hypothetical protein